MTAPAEPLAVDVVVNNHDYADYLPAAIESALAQRHAPLRIIVVDDGSTDGSRAVIDRYGGRVDAVLKDNGGQASAFNAGFAASRAPVVIFLDADDELEPGAAGAAAAAFAADPALAKVQWPMRAIDAAGRLTGERLPPPGLALPQGDQRDAELAFGFDLTWMATSGNAFPRRVLERLMPMPEGPYRVNADWYLQHLTPLLGPVRSLDAPLARRRFHGANAYGSDAARIDLDALRLTITTAAATRAELLRLAGEEGLSAEAAGPRAVSDVANRLISLRLDPARHPVAADARGRLVRSGVRAALRRTDASVALRTALATWFAAMGAAPRPLAALLARWFMFPAARPALRRGAREASG
jgi:hypothetical protein